MKLVMALIFGFLSVLLASKNAFAVCPLCTLAVGTGLGLMHYFGIDDVIAGIWVGAFIFSMASWIQTGKLNKKGWTKWWQRGLTFAVFYGVILSILSLLPITQFGANTLWGVDRLLLGVVIGSLGLGGSYWMYLVIKKRNNDKPWFPFQKVVMPVAAVILLSIIFYYVTEYYKNVQG